MLRRAFHRQRETETQRQRDQWKEVEIEKKNIEGGTWRKPERKDGDLIFLKWTRNLRN